MAVSIAHSAAPAGRTRLAGRTAQLSGEGALDVFTRARALEARGTPVAHLELGEPDFPTPAHVVDAAPRALRDGDTRYTPPAGLPELREAIAEQGRARGIPATAHDVLVTPGAKPALRYAALGVLEPGDEALVPDPGFPIDPSRARFAGATSEQLAHRLLEEFGVALLPGTAFGVRGAGHRRLAFAAAPATIALALTRIHACLDTLATPRGSRS